MIHHTWNEACDPRPLGQIEEPFFARSARHTDVPRPDARFPWQASFCAAYKTRNKPPRRNGPWYDQCGVGVTA